VAAALSGVRENAEMTKPTDREALEAKWQAIRLELDRIEALREPTLWKRSNGRSSGNSDGRIRRPDSGRTQKTFLTPCSDGREPDVKSSRELPSRSASAMAPGVNA
jgi:hypothetical protein